MIVLSLERQRDLKKRKITLNSNFKQFTFYFLIGLKNIISKKVEEGSYC